MTQPIEPSPIDADPYVPTGVPATAEQVAAMVEQGIITNEAVLLLPTWQQPQATTLPTDE